MGLNIGDDAPLFTLKSSTKADVSLNDYAGKNVVVLFSHWHLPELALLNFVLYGTLKQIMMH